MSSSAMPSTALSRRRSSDVLVAQSVSGASAITWAAMAWARPCSASSGTISLMAPACNKASAESKDAENTMSRTRCAPRFSARRA
ncbi:Uncharacterised protein [Bordetella pertussis]|nr:Uncharacterised protein [Bordetella pertussis]